MLQIRAQSLKSKLKSKILTDLTFFILYMESTFSLPLISRIPRISSKLSIESPRDWPYCYSTEPDIGVPSNKTQRSFKKLLLPSRNKQRGSMGNYKGPIGTKARFDYMDSYKNLPKVSERNNYNQLEDTPTVAYLSVISKEKLNPHPFGIIRRAGPAKTIDLRMYSMGDRYADAFSKGLKHIKSVEVLNLKENRLSEKGAIKILENLESKETKRLDLEGNKLGEKAGTNIISLLSGVNSTLKILNLENCNMGNRGAKALCNCITDNRVLRRINLARNNLGDIACKSIGEMLMYNQKLKVLDLHWNKITGQGCSEIFKGLEMNDGLREIDLSWNSIGRNKDITVIENIGKSLKENMVLLHLDISYDNLTKKECDQLSYYLKDNHSLLGIHIEGNHGLIDANGFLIPSDFAGDLERAHFFQRVINTPRGHVSIDDFHNCWICKKCVEMAFT